MKTLATLALGAAIILMSGGAFAMGSPRVTSSHGLHRSAAACVGNTRAQPVWNYSRAAGHFVFAGYECQAMPEGGR